MAGTTPTARSRPTSGTSTPGRTYSADASRRTTALNAYVDAIGEAKDGQPFEYHGVHVLSWVGAPMRRLRRLRR